MTPWLSVNQTFEDSVFDVPKPFFAALGQCASRPGPPAANLLVVCPNKAVQPRIDIVEIRRGRSIVFSNWIPKRKLRRSAAFASRHIETNGRDQNRAFDDVLHIGFYVFQRHAIVKTGHDQCTENRAKYSSSPAHDACAACNAGCD